MKKIQDNYIDWAAEVSKAQKDYKFQPTLTKKLDTRVDDFTENTIHEIILWKTNRYPELNDSIINNINELRISYSSDRARSVLIKLLTSKGFDLPMASTVLRFACPNELQIIDQRVYRFIHPDKNELKIPYSVEAKVEFYFEYIEHLKSICSRHHIPYNKADRILYQLDKNLNSDIPIKY